MARSWHAPKLSRRRKVGSMKRLARTELLEPRLALSGVGNLLGPWYTLLAPQGSKTPGTAATVFAPTADAAVEAGIYANVNLGKAPLLAAGQSSQLANVYQSFMTFNTSGSNGLLSSAILDLTPVQYSGNLSHLTLQIQLLPDSADGWIESGSAGITWNNRPAGTGLTVSIAGSSLKMGSTLAVDVTALLNQSFHTSRTASFEISATSSSTQSADVFFASREYAYSGDRPSLRLTTAPAPTPPPTVATPASASSTRVTGTSTNLSVLGASGAGAAGLAYTWSTTSLPSGAAAPAFSANGSNAANSTSVTFAQAGSYTFQVTIADAWGQTVTSSVAVTVNQTLSTLTLTPGNLTLANGASAQFAAAGIDQFGKAMSGSTAVSWSASAGRITSGGMYTAPAGNLTVTVTATSGAVSKSATVTVGSNFLNLQNADLATLTQTLLATDNAITRNDMLKIFMRVISDGSTVTASEFHDLQIIVGASATLKMPNYVQVLAADVVDGNLANAHYQGQTLGDLTSGSSSAQLTKLVDKWFLGTDHPVASGYTYEAVTGTLFGSGPQYTDLYQGYLGDCYYLSTLGAIAEHSPAAIENMFIANGDNTWTVRFYANGVADYVTVDNQVPFYGGQPIFAGLGPQDKLWVALAEKAYAQWNETGNEGRDGQNNYASIEGGWMDVVNQQVLNQPAYDYNVVSSSDRATMIAALGANEAVTIGTINLPNDPTDGLYSDHAYNVVSYNSGSGMFTLYNPWGMDQPGPLSWTQLTNDCDGFTVANPSGTQPAGLAVAGKLSGGMAAGPVSVGTLAAATTTTAATSCPVVAARTDAAAGDATAVSSQASDGSVPSAIATLAGRRAASRGEKLAAAAVDDLLAGGALFAQS